MIPSALRLPFPTRSSFPLLALSLIAMVSGGTSPRTCEFRASASRERLVRARILQADVVLFKASTSDNGSADVDEVWDYLGGLEFQPTEEFEALELSGGEVLLRGTEGESRTDSPYFERDLTLSIAYGGEVRTRKLKLVRLEQTWRVHPDERRRLFDYRMISREQARELKRPGREH